MHHPGQNCQHFANDILKNDFMNENVRISIRISPKLVPKYTPNMRQAIIWAKGDRVKFRIYAALGANELTCGSRHFAYNCISHVCQFHVRAQFILLCVCQNTGYKHQN